MNDLCADASPSKSLSASSQNFTKFSANCWEQSTFRIKTFTFYSTSNFRVVRACGGVPSFTLITFRDTSPKISRSLIISNWHFLNFCRSLSSSSSKTLCLSKDLAGYSSLAYGACWPFQRQFSPELCLRIAALTYFWGFFDISSLTWPHSLITSGLTRGFQRWSIQIFMKTSTVKHFCFINVQNGGL